jgi:hypothetical protein
MKILRTKTFYLLILVLLGLSIILKKGNYVFPFNKKEKPILELVNGKPLLKVKLLKDFYFFGVVDEILKENYEVQIVEEGYDMIFDGPNKQLLKNKPKDDNIITLQYTWEAQAPSLNEYDLSIGFDLIDHPKYFRLPLYYAFFTDKIHSEHRHTKCNPNKKHFACIIVTNAGGINPLNKMPFDGCTARIRLFHQLSLYKTVQSAGKYLNTIGGPLPGGSSEAMEWAKDCKFMISYENQKYPGYITEKPALAYLAGAVPIYYAHESVFEDVNKDAVILANDFNREEELIDYIKKVDQDDELYCKIWKEQMFNKEGKNYQSLKQQLAKKIISVIENKRTIAKQSK